MKKCYKCNVEINTSLNRCPLCNNPIEEDKKTDDIFPVIPVRTKYKLLLRIMLFTSIFSSIVCLFINYLTSNKIRWSLFVIAGILSFWATFITGIARKEHFIRKIFAEIIVVLLFSVLWDYSTGWNRWSITYVLPFLCIAYITALYFLRILFQYRIKDHIFYLYTNCLIGLIPIIFVLRNTVSVHWPSIISIIYSIFSLVLLFVFNRRQMKNEIQRRLHI